MFLSIAIPIGIIIVYFTAPKQIGMFSFFFFYTLVIQHDKNQKVGSFLHKYRGSSVKKTQENSIALVVLSCAEWPEQLII